MDYMSIYFRVCIVGKLVHYFNEDIYRECKETYISAWFQNKLSGVGGIVVSIAAFQNNN